jgi:WD40 repeat protein
MECFKNENLLKLVCESFILSKAKHLYRHSKSRIISKILLKVLNLKKLFISTGKLKHTIKYAKTLTSVTRFTNNNIITTSEDGNLKIINTDNYNYPVTLPFEDFKYISSMILLPNGNILYSTCFNKIKEIDPRKDFSCVNFCYINEYQCPMNLLSLPDKRIAFSSPLMHSSLLLLDLNDKNNIVKLFTAENDYINSLINLNNDRFACATYHSGIMIWDAGNNGYTCSKVLKGHNNSIKCLLYIREYNSLISGSFYMIEVWDMNNYESIYTINEGAHCLLYLPIGYFATSNQTKRFKIWNLVSYQCVSIFEGHKRRVKFLLMLNDNRIVSASNTEIIIWNNS